MQKNIVKKALVFAVIFLFVAVSFQPVFAIEPSEKVNVDDEKIEYTIQIIKTNKVIENKVYLTKQQADELENLIENIRVDLNNSGNQEETNEIYNTAIDSFNNLGLFPENITIDEVKQLVTGKTQKLNTIKFKNEVTTEFKNILCYVAGSTSETYFIRPSYAFFLRILPLGFLFDFVSYRLLSFFPLRIGDIVFLGRLVNTIESDPIFYHYPTFGWISTIGLGGKKGYSGTFYGNLYEFRTAIVTHLYAGIFGFVGIIIHRINDPQIYYQGYALKVAITTDA